MSAIPVPDFANAEKVCYWQITKGASDQAELGRHYKAKPPTNTKPGHLAKMLANGSVQSNPGHGQAPATMPTDLSIKVETKTNLYMISLGSDTQTRFGPSPHPIQLLPLEYTDLILKDVGLIYLDGAGTEQFVAAANIPANYGSIPASACLAFTVDRAVLESAWKLGVTDSGHSDYALKVPFFLNLYDSASGRPVWAYGKPGNTISTASGASLLKQAKSGGGGPSLQIHGGVHPGSPSQFLY